jgi:prepilin-type N-terminal cleavage/methylation domain-containing protein
MVTRESGFTLTELLVALGIMGLMLAAAAGTLQVGLGSVQASVDKADAQQNARLALERMVQEIRGAGYDPKAVPPTTYPFAAVAGRTATALTLQNNFNGSVGGVLGNGLDPQGACDPLAPTAELVAYRLVGTELRRSTDPPTHACQAVVMTGVSALTFSYLDADGGTVPLSASSDGNVRSVVVSVIGRSTSGGTEYAVSMADRVRLRNR